MAISNKEKFLQQKHEIRSIRYFYSGTDIYDTYKDVDTLAEKQDISADFLYEMLVNEPVSINNGLETYIKVYNHDNGREEFVFIQILRYKKFWKPDVSEDEVDRRYYENTGHKLIHTDLTEEEIDARMEEYFRQQEKEHFKVIKSSVCNDYYKLNTKPTEEDVWRNYRHMEEIRDDLKAISSYLNNSFKAEFDIVDSEKYEGAMKALETLSDYLSHFQR